MTSKATQLFLTELIALCRKHNLTISASGYDRLQVWPNEGNAEAELLAAEDHAALQSYDKEFAGHARWRGQKKGAE